MQNYTEPIEAQKKIRKNTTKRNKEEEKRKAEKSEQHASETNCVKWWEVSSRNKYPISIYLAQEILSGLRGEIVPVYVGLSTNLCSLQVK